MYSYVSLIVQYTVECTVEIKCQLLLVRRIRRVSAQTRHEFRGLRRCTPRDRGGDGPRDGPQQEREFGSHQPAHLLAACAQPDARRPARPHEGMCYVPRARVRLPVPLLDTRVLSPHVPLCLACTDGATRPAAGAGAGGRPAGGHREADPRDGPLVHRERQHAYPCRHAGQRGSGQLGRAEDREGGGPGRRAHHRRAHQIGPHGRGHRRARRARESPTPAAARLHRRREPLAEGH